MDVSFFTGLWFFFYQEHLAVLKEDAPNADQTKLEQLMSAAYALVSPELLQISLPDFPVDSLHVAALILVRRICLFLDDS